MDSKKNITQNAVHVRTEENKVKTNSKEKNVEKKGTEIQERTKVLRSKKVSIPIIQVTIQDEDERDWRRRPTERK